MKKLILTSALILSSIFAVQAHESEKSTVSVRAQAEREVAPNEIHLQIYVDKATLKNKQEIPEVEKQIIDILNKMNVDLEEYFRVKDMGSTTKVGIIRRKNQQNATYLLQLSSSSQVYTFIEAVEKLNIRAIDIIKTDISNREEIIMELRAEAMKNAQTNARTLAQAIGQNIGAAVRINDETQGYNYQYRKTRTYAVYANAEMAHGATDEEKQSELKFENIELKAVVSVDFLLTE